MGITLVGILLRNFLYVAFVLHYSLLTLTRISVYGLVLDSGFHQSSPTLCHWRCLFLTRGDSLELFICEARCDTLGILPLTSSFLPEKTSGMLLHLSCQFRR
ncbi:hypothetical protein K439DRAFT_814591 [Ramaria rubella]|nr:hypothetical protein K439DRAFT_814591 [Ramaria rubella]